MPSRILSGRLAATCIVMPPSRRRPGPISPSLEQTEPWTPAFAGVGRCKTSLEPVWVESQNRRAAFDRRQRSGSAFDLVFSKKARGGELGGGERVAALFGGGRQLCQQCAA